MLQRVLLFLAVFVAIFLALTFGEKAFDILHDILLYVYHIFASFFWHFQGFFDAILDKLTLHPTKLLLALIISIPVCFWIFKNKRNELNQQASPRKISIFLAIVLGWLGVHHFYNRKFGMGFLYLIISFIWLPLAVLLGFIDGIRYFCMNDESFNLYTA